MKTSLRYASLLLPVALANLSHAADFTVTVDTNTDLNFGVGVFVYESANFNHIVLDPNTPADMATGTHTFQSSVTESFTTGRYAYLGLYDNETGLSVSLDNDIANDAIANGKDYVETLNPNVNEDELIHYLQLIRSDDPIAAEEARDEITSFVNSIREDLPRLTPSLVGAPGTMTKFSQATFGGTISAQPVPEPTTLLPLSLGAFAFLKRKKK